MRLILLALALLTVQPLYAADTKNTANRLGIGQGISSPTSTSTVNFSSGYTAESPLGTIYQNGVRLTGEYVRNDSNSEGIGAELGYGTGEWGIAGGYYKPNCDGCDGRAGAAIGVTAGNFGFGIRFAEDLYSAAILINPQGMHRFGIMGQLNEGSDDTARLTAYGLGYSYVAQQFTLTLDASGRSFKDTTIDDHRILVTPGLMIRADIVQLSVNDRITVNRDKNDPSQDGKDHDFWFGIGFGGDSWHIAGYSDYVAELSLVGTLFF